MAHLQLVQIDPAAFARRVWILAVPVAVTVAVLAHHTRLAPPAAAPTTVAPEEGPLITMPADPQTGWRPAALAPALELQFAPSAALQQPRYIHT